MKMPSSSLYPEMPENPPGIYRRGIQVNDLVGFQIQMQIYS